MIKPTTREKLTLADLNYLLTFEAFDLNEKLIQKRDEAYLNLDLHHATKLETLVYISQERLNRRFNNLIH